MNTGSSYENIVVTNLGLQIRQTAKNYAKFKLLMLKNEEFFKIS